MLDRPALHAAELGFEHPASSEHLHFAAALPADLAALHAELNAREGRSREDDELLSCEEGGGHGRD
jgi:hypothetical protein